MIEIDKSAIKGKKQQKSESSSEDIGIGRSKSRKSKAFVSSEDGEMSMESDNNKKGKEPVRKAAQTRKSQPPPKVIKEVNSSSESSTEE